MKIVPSPVRGERFVAPGKGGYRPPPGVGNARQKKRRNLQPLQNHLILSRPEIGLQKK